ncbi:MAG TPA: methionine synthase, partial [Blastocatellia bacterium]|nr:methionine synthase [Blastocatellia bacterium]
MTERIITTVVGSYPVPGWLVGNTSEVVLRDAQMVVLKTQELAGIDLITDGELSRFDPSHPEANGMVDYFVEHLDGIRKRLTVADLQGFYHDRGLGARSLPSG